MTSTIEKLIGLVETIVTTIVEIRTSQINIEKQQKEVIKASEETNKINKEILDQLKEINTKMDIVEEETEESADEDESSTEENITSQDQVNAFFNAFMNTMQSQVKEEVGSPDNEYPGYTIPSQDNDIEAIAAKIRNNAKAQQSINGDQFSSLDNFDFDKNFGGSSFNQSNDKPPEQPVYHRVEATPTQMNLDAVFNGATQQPTGNNWYNENNAQKTYHIGLTPDHQALIFRRTCNNQSIALPPIYQNSIAWNTIVNMLKTENRKLSSLTNAELEEFSGYIGDLASNGVDVYSPVNQNILNQFNNVTHQNSNNDMLDVADVNPTPGMAYPTQAVSSPINNQYNPTPQPVVQPQMFQQPTQDCSRRNMSTVQRSYVSNNMTYSMPVNNMWAHYGEEIANNSSKINQQPQNVSYTTNTQQTNNFTNGGYTNPFTVKPVFGGSSFSIYG